MTSLQLTGLSGTRYPFWFPQSLDTTPRLPCVYVLMRRGIMKPWDYLYIGEADDAYRRLNVDTHVGDGHARARQQGATHFAIMLSSSSKDRRCWIESDLVKAYDPSCNKNLRLPDELLSVLAGLMPMGPGRA